MNLNRQIKKLNTEINADRLQAQRSYTVIKHSAGKPTSLLIAFLGGFALGYFVIPKAAVKLKNAAQKIEVKKLGSGLFNGLMFLPTLARFF